MFRPASAGPPHLAVRWCRFEGMFRSAVHIDCPIEADMQFNRFYSLRNDERPPEAEIIDAVAVKVPASGPVRLVLASIR